MINGFSKLKTNDKVSVLEKVLRRVCPLAPSLAVYISQDLWRPWTALSIIGLETFHNRIVDEETVKAAEVQEGLW